ncbi:S-adenosyl-L-methionine-dependent methyltransferase [Phakopsora pachyrhizi]|uniref:S-adenosyl-L-methionine-dependent methyltransferase n=1 Tax=Phakopsora pachyrhizi TaxID=170000 RepID=A0AAV0AIZ4_PHAPC|nr:S-adenosyl-L-methionine-dependent methyltransferase [Phakopsora pachyrhizi]
MISLARGKLDEEEDDHRASSISIKAPFPKQSRIVNNNNDKVNEEGEDVNEVYSKSKIGRRKFDGSSVDPWKFNAWDDVEWDEDLERNALEIVKRQIQSPVPQEIKLKFNENPKSFWDSFYEVRRDTFFKNRSWLMNEFRALDESIKPKAGKVKIVELGCGPGNTAFPILSSNQNPELFLYALDYSSKAIDLLKNNPLYDPSKVLGLVWDMSTSDGIPSEIEAGSIDIVLMIFCFSALQPSDWSKAIRNVSGMLKPGGVLLFRDYGRHDLTQLRMKGSRFMEDNLYIRGDGTRVYFFDRDDDDDDDDGKRKSSGLEVVDLKVDRRLLLNRARKLKMYRVWLQVCFIIIITTLIIGLSLIKRGLMRFSPFVYPFLY